jgi:hypothetical protein
VSASDVLQFWEADQATRVIALSLRSLGNPRRSAAIARRVSRRKPVLLWLADLPAPPPEELVRALGAHTGMLRCASLDDLLDVAEALLAPAEAPARDGVAARIEAWERWRRSAPGRIERPEGVDRFEARRRIDAVLARSPEGTVLEGGDVAALLRSYGVRTVELAEAQRGRPWLRVVQDPAWGSLVALDARPGESEARLVPLTNRDVRALAAPGKRALRAERADLLHRIATLAADVPELASLALALPAREGEQPALLPGSARVAPWTLGPAL